MAILAECDICGSQHRVKDSLAKSTMRCQDCGVTLIVPEGNEISADAFIEEGGRLIRRNPPAEKPWWTWIAGFGIAILLLLTIVQSIQLIARFL